MPVRRKYIHSLVDKLLLTHGIKSAPIRVEEIARQLGADVVYQAADDDLSGFLFRDYKQRNAIIGVNAKHHPNRQRFTIAHEIGHFLLHEYEGFHFDGDGQGFQVRLRDDESRKGTDDDEKEANLFGAELLMPERLLRADISKIPKLDLFNDEGAASFKKLANRYQVSVRALTYRLANLGYIHL
jgi:Zn-dependent peptidase ImmA (M78 family)